MEKSKKVLEGRRSTLKKKANEIVTLYNVRVCVVCLEPDGDLHVWPENPKEAQSIIGKYREASKKGSKCKRKEKLHLSVILKTTIQKLEKQALVKKDKLRIISKMETLEDCRSGIKNLPRYRMNR